MRAPGVALVVPSYDGREHLPALLDSVSALEHPPDRLETIVVDDASTDDTLALLADRYPWARVVALPENRGFAGAVNAGAAAASADVLALCNNDMRLDPLWLRELLAVYDPDGGRRLVAGTILDWSGERIDFAGGSMTFHGTALQDGFGEPRGSAALDDRELLFPCGGSMLVERSLFLDAGGFDEAFFAFYEDADLGWRLRIAGHRTRLAARALSFHRHHGTVGALSVAERAHLYERNALRMLIKNVGDEHLPRVLAGALLLLAERAELDRGLQEDVRAARARAAADVLDDLPSLRRLRAQVQSRRRVPDEEVFALFGRPFFAAVDHPRYRGRLAEVARELGLDAIFHDAAGDLAALSPPRWPRTRRLLGLR